MELYHSIYFNDGTESLFDIQNGKPNGKNTWEDWHLIPASKPAIPYPEVDLNFVSVEGMSGTIDSSEMITGDVDPNTSSSSVTDDVARSIGDLELYDYGLGRITYRPAVRHITYSNRSGDLDFYVTQDKEDWISIRKKIAQYLNGKRIKMILEDEPGYYYEGRFTFETWKTDPKFSHVNIKYQLDPFRYPINYGTSQNPNYSNPYWDPFNFETDYFDVSATYYDEQGNPHNDPLPVDQSYIEKLKAGVL